jgi:CopG family nickel-responsive transcriptional regulator
VSKRENGQDQRRKAAKKGAVPKEVARRPLVSRISMSLSEELLSELDAMVGERGFASRSQAVASVLNRSLVKHRHEVGDRVMVGTITLCYDHTYTGLQADLAALQQANVAEVISSLHVHLMNNRTLEVVLVQGPADALQAIADQMITRKGVISGHLELVAALIPQLHPFRP